MGHRGTSWRERSEVTFTALLAAALGLLGPMAGAAGRLSWLAPVIALPVGLLLCRLWSCLGERSLNEGLEEAFGTWLGRGAELAYLLWVLVLLTESARRYARRLLSTVQGESPRWLFLAVGLVLAVWLSRGDGAVFARTGRLFFLAVLVMTALILVLALPAVDWRNLWPPERADLAGLGTGAALALSLAGYGIYALSLPGREGDRGRRWSWTVLGCGGLAALELAVVGAFGPTLTGRMKEPFLFLLEGVAVPGAFRRGEAALGAVLALADLVLLALLTRGLKSLWQGVAPGLAGRGTAVMAAGAFWLAGALPEGETAVGLSRMAVPMGNLVFGILLPGIAVLTRWLRTGRGGRPISCGSSGPERTDVGGSGP